MTTSSVSQVQKSSYSVAHSIVMLPLTTALAPLYLVQAVVDKVKMCTKICFGYLLNTVVFSFAMWQRSPLRRALIDLYKGGCYDTHNRTRFNPKRLEESKNLLWNLGATPLFPTTKNGLVLDGAYLSYDEIKAKIENAGGKIHRKIPVGELKIAPKQKKQVHDIRYYETRQISSADLNSVRGEIDVIFEDETPSGEDWIKKHHQWQKMKECLDGAKFDKITLKGSDGKIRTGYLINALLPGTKRPEKGMCFVHLTAPTESFPMGKRALFRQVLGFEADVITADYPGTGESEGVPSEGSYILAAEAMVEEAIARKFSPSKIWLEGFCLGGSVAIGAAMHLRKVLPSAINLLTQNTFCCLRDAISQQGWLAKKLSGLAIEGVLSWDDKINSMVPQSCFDNQGLLRAEGAKIETAKDKKQGACLIINGTPDTTLHYQSRQILEAAAKTCFENVSSVEISYCDSAIKNTECHDGNHKCGVNAHSKDVMGNRECWQKAMEMFAKQHPQPIVVEEKPNLFKTIVNYLDPSRFVWIE